MNLSLNEEQLLIKSSAEKFFQDNLSFEQRNKLIVSDSKLCEDLILKSKELGWYALPFDQKFGGLGGNITDVMTLIETFGKSLHIDPYIFSLLFPGKIIEHFCDEEKKSYYLDKIINGNLKFAYCFAEPNLRFDIHKLNCEVHIDENKYFLKGKKILVVAAAQANSIIVPAIDKDKNVYFVKIDKTSKGFLSHKYKIIDDSNAVDYEFDGLEFNENDILIKLNHEEYKQKISIIFDYLTLAVCSEALGVIEKMYELTLEYVKTREQFGKRIGDFQVIQHRMVEMYIIKEEMRSLNCSAQVSFFNNDSKERVKSISLNKIFLDSKAKEVAQDCIQLHGGMGVANEMSIGHFFKKLTFLSMLFGDADYHYKRYELADKI